LLVGNSSIIRQKNVVIPYFFVIFAKSFGKKFRTFLKFIDDLTDRKGYENLSRAARHPSVEIK